MSGAGKGPLWNSLWKIFAPADLSPLAPAPDANGELRDISA